MVVAVLNREVMDSIIYNKMPLKLPVGGEIPIMSINSGIVPSICK
jgi:hypothetical protein